MAGAPESIQLQTQDFPPENKPLLDKLLPALQRQFDATRVNLAGGLTRANGAGQDLTITINTPATDWITLNLAAGWTSTVAQSNGFAPPRFRWVDGTLFFDGACEFIGTVVGLPITVVNTPALGGNIPTGAVTFNTDPVAWVNVNSGAYAAAGLLRVDSSGVLSLRSAGTSSPATPWAQITFLGMNFSIATPGLVTPALSCFPITVQTTVQQPTRVTVSKILDVTTPVPALVAVSPGGLYWDVGAPGQVVIKNLAGLALGRQYAVTLYVEP